MPTALDARIAHLDNCAEAARHERAAHELRGDPEAAETSAEEAFRYEQEATALVVQALDAEALAEWMANPERGDDWVPQEVAAKFIADGWAPSGASGPGIVGVVSGVEWVGARDEG